MGNERQIQKQKDLMENDQTYIQREYIDAKDKFQNDRYILIDKINKLETENNQKQITEQTLTKQLALKTEMCMLLEEKLDAMRKSTHQREAEHNKQSQELFVVRQTIKNLKMENELMKNKISQLQDEGMNAAQNNMQRIKMLEMDKLNLQNEHSVLLSDFKQMKDELEIYRAQKAMITKKKKKKGANTKKAKQNAKSSRDILKKSIKAKEKIKKITVRKIHRESKVNIWFQRQTKTQIKNQNEI